MPLMETPYFGFVDAEAVPLLAAAHGDVAGRPGPLGLPRRDDERDRARRDVLAKVDALYAEYGRGHDGMQLPYITRCYRAVVRHQELPPEVAAARRSTRPASRTATARRPDRSPGPSGSRRRTPACS